MYQVNSFSNVFDQKEAQSVRAVVAGVSHVDQKATDLHPLQVCLVESVSKVVVLKVAV